MSDRTDRWISSLSEPPPEAIGTRIRLVSMGPDPDPVSPGTLGTVTGGNGGQMNVDWDDGRRLALVPGIDRWAVVRE